MAPLQIKKCKFLRKNQAVFCQILLINLSRDKFISRNTTKYKWAVEVKQMAKALHHFKDEAF